MANPIITGLSLCAGVGMLDEGVRAGLEYLGYRYKVLGYAEWDAYAIAALVARMDEASLEPAPIWCDDLAKMDAESLRGRVGILSAGFPCQPWSVAGKQSGKSDERWIWDDILGVIDRVQPEWLFLENVPGLASGDPERGALADGTEVAIRRDGLDAVLRTLAERGFDAEWTHVSAQEVGASHRRERVFILAVAAHAQPAFFGQFRDDIHGTRSGDMAQSPQRGLGIVREPPGRDGQPDGSNGVVANSEQLQRGKRTRRKRVLDAGASMGNAKRTRRTEANGRALDAGSEPTTGSGPMGDPERIGSGEQEPRRGPHRRTAVGRPGAAVADAGEQGLPITEQPGQPGQPGQPRTQHHDGPAVAELRGACADDGYLFAPGPNCEWWGEVPPYLYPAIEPGLCLLAPGLAVALDESRADQLRCSGNGVVPLAAAVAFVELARRILQS